MKNASIKDCDYLVAGSGIAGLICALSLAETGRRIVLITKKTIMESNTFYAQGGIACPQSSADINSHISDTLEVGCGLCNKDVVRAIIEGAPEAIARLKNGYGIEFTRREDGNYDLGLEAGHSARRILHCGDVTGRKIVEVLVNRLRTYKNVTVMENTIGIELITTSWLGLPGKNVCVGMYVYNCREGKVEVIRAMETILAMGGGGKVYLYTTNPDTATGDGIAMAYRAGLPILNMEFIQFHPTCLYHPKAKSFLISETVRGEGGKIINRNGEEFLYKYDPRGAMAPRDIVARAIDDEMKHTGAECVFLDIRHKSSAFLRKRFPTIYKTCANFGIDMSKDLIPVVPAAHYFCGGIKAGIDGSTELPGLSCCGEVACTGFHGANRLASNSLLEAIVCGFKTTERLKKEKYGYLDFLPNIPDWHSGEAVLSDEEVVIEHNWNEVRSCMWDYVGIVRSDKRLERAIRRIRNIRNEVKEYYLNYIITPDLIELRNIACVAELIIRSAIKRKESRGLHYSIDYPSMDNRYAFNTIIQDPPGDHIMI